MFDGNFRSGRKEVNLSGGSGGRRRRKGAADNNNINSNSSSSKQAILRNAEIQRKQRQEHQRRSKAARLVQRCTRGWLGRLHLMQKWLPSTAHQSLPAAAYLVSTCRSWLAKQSSNRLQVLTAFYRESSSLLSADADKNSGENDDENDDMDIGSQHGGSSVSYSHTSWLSQRQLVRATLEELSPTTCTNTNDLEALFSLVQTYLPSLMMNSRAINDDFFLIMSQCLAQWVSSLNSTSELEVKICTSLCQWSIQMSIQLPSPHAKALLASVLLSGDISFLSQLPGDLYTAWVTPLAKALDSTTTPADILQRTTWENLQDGKESIILSNLLETDSLLLKTERENPSAVLQLIFHTLNNSDDLALLSSLLVRGDSFDVSTKNRHSTSSTNTSSQVDHSDDDEEDYDDGEDKLPTLSDGGDANKKPRQSNRLLRKDLLTLQKLDRLYQDTIQQRKRECPYLLSGSSIKSSAVSKLSMAKTLVGAPWLSWGLQVLSNQACIKSGATRLYLDSLGLLMQAMTTLRPTTKVGIMSPLAFRKEFMLDLWKYVVSCPEKSAEDSSHKNSALSIFCDLFAHYLVALSDVDFLNYHTMVETTQGIEAPHRSKGIMAIDVIQTLRTVLYGLYWNVPVHVDDVSAQRPRGRLILSGTKVWNSLHERWNRLARKYSFCDESVWWFPHLSSREGDGAVIPERQRTASRHDDESMDIEDSDSDSDSEDQPMNAAEAETDALADAFSDPKMARILTCIPQALPFNRRLKLFNSLLKADKQKSMQAASNRGSLMAMMDENAEMFFDGIARERVTIRRAKLYDDSMQQLSDLGPKLKHRVQVSFVNQHGTEEAGIDGGGVFKEFLDDLIKDGFGSLSDDDGASTSGAPPLFSVTPLQTLAVNFDIADDSKMLKHYEFLGRVLGKAVYESILVEPQFCLPFLNQLLGKVNSMEDLKNYDEEYYKNLNKLKLLDDSQIEALGLTFELTVGSKSKGTKGLPRTVDLIPNGKLIPVKTKVHAFQYIHAVSNQLLNVQGSVQTKAFLKGFRDLIPASWVRLFSANELQNLISGDDSIRGIDVASLKRSMNYLGGYHQSQPYIQDFWEIVEHELSPDQQRKFLRFMTSCSRQPLLGFGSLDPTPSIQQIRLTESDLMKNSKLPTSQTCFNLLKLPNYKDKSILKNKLLAAIESGAGFELT